MNRRAFLGSVPVATAFSGCASLSGVVDPGSLRIESITVADRTDHLVYEVAIHDRSVRPDSPGRFAFAVANEGDRSVVFETGVPGPFGLLAVTPSSTAGESQRPLHFWSDSYEAPGSDVGFDDGTFTVTSQVLRVPLRPGERANREFQVRSDRDLGPIRATRYEGTYRYAYQHDDTEWSDEKRTLTATVSLGLDLAEKT